MIGTLFLTFVSCHLPAIFNFTTSPFSPEESRIHWYTNTCKTMGDYDWQFWTMDEVEFYSHVAHRCEFGCKGKRRKNIWSIIWQSRRAFCFCFCLQTTKTYLKNYWKITKSLVLFDKTSSVCTYERHKIYLFLSYRKGLCFWWTMQCGYKRRKF